MGVPLTQAAGLGFVRSPLWGSPAHPSRLSLTPFWSVAGEIGATPREDQNPEGWPQRLGNIVPVPDSQLNGPRGIRGTYYAAEFCFKPEEGFGKLRAR